MANLQIQSVESERELLSLGHPIERRNTGVVPARLNRQSVALTEEPVPAPGLFQGVTRFIRHLLPENRRFARAESHPELQPQPPNKSVEQEMDIETYALKEWTTTKPNAMRMKKGYSEVKDLGLSRIRRIRGDNYCALRSILFQILTLSDLSKSILGKFPTMSDAVTRLKVLNNSHHDFIKSWSFGGNERLKRGGDEMGSLTNCIKTFYEYVPKLKNEPLPGRRDKVVSMLNTSKNGHLDTDAKLMEFVKFLMLSQAAYMYEQQARGEDIPMWFLLLTLRSNSSNLEEFFKYHLNQVGDGLGLEQVEMFLLALALNVRIKAFRLKAVGQEDFMTMYPPLDDTLLPHTAEALPVIAEDDRHYNVVYPQDI